MEPPGPLCSPSSPHWGCIPPTYRGSGGEAVGHDGTLVCGSDNQGVAAMTDLIV